MKRLLVGLMTALALTTAACANKDDSMVEITRHWGITKSSITGKCYEVYNGTYADGIAEIQCELYDEWFKKAKARR